MSESSGQSEILLVDDRDENLLALESALQSPDYKLIKANSGDDALRYLLDHKPALILLDVQMPKLDGYATAAIIKGSERTRDIPIIFLTALSRDEHFVLKGYETGAVDYINKPFDIDILRSKVRVFVDLQAKNEELLRTERELRTAENLERERRLALLELRSLRREQIQQKRFHDLVQGINHGIIWSARVESLAFSYVGPTAEKLLGYSHQQWIGEPDFWMNHIHPEDKDIFLAACRKAAENHQPAELEHRFLTLDGRTVWLHTGLRISSLTESSALELQGLSIDITRLKEAEHSLQSSKIRSDLLARASLMLADSFENTAGLKEVARLIVPRFADWFSVDIFSDSKFKTVSLECIQPLDAAVAMNEFNAGAPDLHTENDFAYMFETGNHVLYREVTEKAVERAAGSDRRQAILKQLKSLMMVPIKAHGQSLGVVMIGSMQNTNAFAAEDLAFLDGLANHIAAALEISRLYKEAQAAVHLRDEFLSVASHELKTPLTPLKLQIQQLLRMSAHGKDFNQDNVSQMLGSSDRQINRLTTLIEGLLDISRISNGKLQLELKGFRLDELIQEIVQRFARQFEDARCRVELNLSPKLNVHWDQFRVEQVIVNLLTNAIKFAAEKPIYIRAYQKGANTYFSVQDEGIGISDDDQKRIFKRFERGTTKAHFGGMGLGLYIVSQILELHDGRIRVESHPGKGSKFIVEIPSAGPSEKSAEAMTASE